MKLRCFCEIQRNCFLVAELMQIMFTYLDYFYTERLLSDEQFLFLIEEVNNKNERILRAFQHYNNTGNVHLLLTYLKSATGNSNNKSKKEDKKN